MLVGDAVKIGDDVYTAPAGGGMERKSRSRYRPGGRFGWLEDMYAERVVWVHPWSRAHPVSFFLGWQWHMVRSWVMRGLIVRAELIDGAK